jgi:hypothetical protein
MRMRLCVLTASVICTGALATIDGQSPRPVAHHNGPTFSKDVAPILFKNCAGCHRPGEIAPMSLLTYDEARPWARAIAKVVANRTMPPWHADAPPGTFHNERILSDADRRTLLAWADGGAPKGDPKDLPPAPSFHEGWSIGQPDVVLEMLEDFKIPSSGTVQYEHFYIPTNFAETKWVKALEVRPGNRAVVHHVLVYYVAKPQTARAAVVRPNEKDGVFPRQRIQGDRPRRNDLGDAVRRLVATYAPGTNPQIAPQGTAFRLEPGGTLELQMHYTTTGVAATDRTKVGIVFAAAQPPVEALATAFYNATFTLPAGAADVPVATDVEFLQDGTVWGLFPHTHLRGKKWDYKLVLPGGEIKPILSVSRYDFNWQTYYMFKEPLQVPRGAKIVSTAWYDNSAANRFNPDPKIDVTWGDQTWEEMQYTGIVYSAR